MGSHSQVKSKIPKLPPGFVLEEEKFPPLPSGFILEEATSFKGPLARMPVPTPPAAASPISRFLTALGAKGSEMFTQEPDIPQQISGLFGPGGYGLLQTLRSLKQHQERTKAFEAGMGAKPLPAPIEVPGEVLGSVAGISPVAFGERAGTGDVAGALGEAALSPLTYGLLRGIGPKIKRPEFAERASKLREGSVESLGRVFKPGEKEIPKFKEGLAPKIIEKGIPLTTERTLIKRIKTSQEQARTNLDKAWERFDEKVPIKEVQAEIDKATSRFIIDNVDVAPQITRNLNRYKQIIGKWGKEVSPESLRKTRQIWDQLLERQSAFEKRGLQQLTAMQFAQKEASNALRRVLAKKNPDVAKANAELHFHLELGDLLEKKGIRQFGKEIRGPLERVIAPTMATTAVALSNPQIMAAAIGVVTLERFVHSTLWHLGSAKFKNWLADNLAYNPQQAASVMNLAMTAPDSPVIKGLLTEGIIRLPQAGTFEATQPAEFKVISAPRMVQRGKKGQMKRVYKGESE